MATKITLFDLPLDIVREVLDLVHDIWPHQLAELANTAAVRRA
jgi:hypothetical protein